MAEINLDPTLLNGPSNVNDGKIFKLPESTIRLIAAGEVITKPVNVVKELMENSIDAGATNIRIKIEQGGIKLVEIVDNGHGIARCNAELLCSRYATSKISTANDLSRISTFGFRGEALASISEMADVEVRTFNMRANLIGWQANYKCGALVGPPENKYFQNHGTQIKVTNLFGSARVRKNSVQSVTTTEKRAIVDLVLSYAMHYRETITMSLQDGESPDLVCLLAPISSGPCFGMFFGTEMENNLIEFEHKHDGQFQVDIDFMFSYKKPSTLNGNFSLILFINDRLVECPDLKKELETLLHQHLSSKNYNIVSYLGLKVPACDIDVNVHPSKAMVSLHYQVEIVALIVDKLHEKLKETLSSRVVSGFTTTSTQTVPIRDLLASPTESIRSSYSQTSQSSSVNRDRLNVLAPSCLNSQPQNLNSYVSTSRRPHDLIHNDSTQKTLTQMGYASKPLSRPTSPDIIRPERERRDMKLESLIELRQQVAKEKSKETAKTVKNSVFVGIFDHYRALIQHETRLYAINLKAFLKEQYYQFYLYDLGNFPPIEILPPGNKVKPLIEMYLNDIRQHENAVYERLKYKTFSSIIEKLMENANMLEDYLSLKLTKDEIITLPCIMPNEVPNLIFLGKFLTEMANTVDYAEERECLRTMGRVIADFYSEPPANLKDRRVHRQYHDLIESKLYVAIKNYLLIPEWLFTTENMAQISDTKDLYKVFERC